MNFMKCERPLRPSLYCFLFVSLPTQFSCFRLVAAEDRRLARLAAKAEAAASVAENSTSKAGLSLSTSRGAAAKAAAASLGLAYYPSNYQQAPTYPSNYQQVRRPFCRPTPVVVAHSVTGLSA